MISFGHFEIVIFLLRPCSNQDRLVTNLTVDYVFVHYNASFVTSCLDVLLSNVADMCTFSKYGAVFQFGGKGTRTVDADHNIDILVRRG